MTKSTSIKTDDLERYDNLNLHQIEQTISELEKESSTLARGQLHAARQALRNRQRIIKAEVMSFEEHNDHHLLFYDSTASFCKLAGHSVLFFSMTIAQRINWRGTPKSDTDHYHISDDGVMFFRSLTQISSHLAAINILPDDQLNTPELHFFKLDKTYTAEQIAKLRDRTEQVIDRIQTLTLPDSPFPALYTAITSVYGAIFREFQQISNQFARTTIGHRMVMESYEMTLQYHFYASYRGENREQYLLKIANLAKRLRFGMNYISRLRILHQRDICRILEDLLAIERLAGSAYRKAKSKA